MRFTLLSIVWLTGALLLQAQASPEEEAIAEILRAKDYGAVEKHLPEQLRTALSTMDKTGREHLLSRPLVMMKEKGLKISEPRDGRAVVAFDVELSDADIRHFELRTRRRISNGAEAVLVLACVAPEKSWGDAEIWMKFDQGEWRVTELTDPSGYGKINLEDPDTIAEIAPTPLQANEQSAVANLRILVTALESYSSEYSGMPDNIDALGGPADAEPSSDHALLIDSKTATTHVQSGYRFDYQRTSVDSYYITATPLDFGKSGTRNFFVDESEVIRFTDEDHPATANDRMLNGRLGPGLRQ